MGKKDVLQATYKMTFKPLIGNRLNKMKSLGHTRRRQGMALNIRQSVVPLANVLIL